MSELEDISQRVISVIEGIDGLSHLRVNELSSIPLGTVAYARVHKGPIITHA